MSEFRHFGKWIRAVSSHWYGWAGGTLISIVLFVGQAIWNWQPSKLQFVVILFVGLFWSMFAAWRDEHILRLKSEKNQGNGLAEEDPKVFLEPLNAEFIACGYIPFRISNQGQRVNPAQGVTIQPIKNVPSIVFDYIDRIDPADKKVIVPTVGDFFITPIHNILPDLRKAWSEAHERGEIDSDVFDFTIAIHYRDAKQLQFVSVVSLRYSPIAESSAHRDAMKAQRPEYPIITVTNTDIRRLG
jgi:hypothetical protein